MAIFNHRDSDDDDLEVRTHDDYPNDLYFDIARAVDGENSSVRVSREAVLRLHSALGEWLYPVHTPEGPNRALIEALVAKAVRDQVSAILPLHLRPAQVSPCGTCGHEGSGHTNECDTDPEPHDVGHAEEPVAKAEPYQRPFHMCSKADCKVPGCTAQHLSGIHGRYEAPRPCDTPLEPGQRLSDVHGACGFLWALHRAPGTDNPAPCEELVQEDGVLLDVHEACGRLWVLHKVTPRPKAVETEPEHGRLMADLPRRPKAAPKCLDCLHGWGEHTGGICWGMSPMQERDGDAGCRCTRERPSATGTVLCTCPRSPGMHPHGPDGCMHPSCTCKWVRPRAADPRYIACTCDHPRQVHGPHGCGYLGECACKYAGEAS